MSWEKWNQQHKGQNKGSVKLPSTPSQEMMQEAHNQGVSKQDIKKHGKKVSTRMMREAYNEGVEPQVIADKERIPLEQVHQILGIKPAGSHPTVHPANMSQSGAPHTHVSGPTPSAGGMSPEDHVKGALGPGALADFSQPGTPNVFHTQSSPSEVASRLQAAGYQPSGKTKYGGARQNFSTYSHPSHPNRPVAVEGSAKSGKRTVVKVLYK